MLHFHYAYPHGSACDRDCGINIVPALDRQRCSWDHCASCRALDPAPPPCPECRGVGWLLNEHHAGSGSQDPGQPLSLDLVPCFYPECTAPFHTDENGVSQPRAIATLGIRGQFTDVVRSPRGTLLALTGFTEPVWR